MNRQAGTPLPWLALAGLAGVAWVETRASLPSLGQVLLLLLVALPLVRGARASWPGVRASWLGVPASWVGVLVLGVAWATTRAQLQLADRLETSLENETIVLVGRVASIPAAEGPRVQFDLAPSYAQAGSAVRVPERVRLSWYDAPHAPRAGETWQLEVRLRQPRGFANPGGFDYERQLFREGIGATGYVRASSRNRRIAAAHWRDPVLRARAGMAERIHLALRDSPAAGVLAGLAVGATVGISAGQWQVFSITGTTHLIAISGLHVTMVAGLAMGIGGLLWRCLPRPPRLARQDACGLFGFAAALVYSLLAGFSVPTQRTLVMLLVAFAWGWLRRQWRPTHVLSVALLAVLTLDPHAALAPGFWLSFVAVGVILFALGGGIAVGLRLREFLRTQWAITLALAPVTLALFGSLSLIAPLANLFAIPLFSLVLVPLTLIAVALQATVSSPGDWLLLQAAHLFEATWPVLALAAQSEALVHLPRPTLATSAMLAVAAFVALTPLPLTLRLLGLATLLPLLLPPAGSLPAAHADVDVLDVGQGLAVVVRTRHHTLVYDTGPSFRSGRTAGDLALVPFLHERGIRRIDLLVLSHADDDHAGGAAALARSLPIAAVRHGGPAPRLGVPAAPCERGERWNWDGVDFQILHPVAGERWRDNDGSCVLRVATRAHALLLTGDIERAAELRLRAHGLSGGADALVVPHHGSRSSSTPELAAALGARLAIVSAGHANRWNFPHPEVVRRWCEAGAAVLETSQWGAVSLRLGARASPLEPSAYRVVNRRYWHTRAPRAGASRCAAPAPVSSAAISRQARAPAEEAAQHVGNRPGRRAVHVAAHIVLDRRSRHRAGAAVDAAAQARVADRAHRPGVEVAQRQPGQ